MTTKTDTSVDISFDAADHIQCLGVWPEFKTMLEHTRATVPRLRSISVSLDKQVDSDEPAVLILANVEEPGAEVSGLADESAEWEWDRWAVATFSPEVLRHFCLMAVPAADAEDDGR
jgi:hypothetical protein